MDAVENLPNYSLILLDPDRLFRETLAHSLRSEKFEVVQNVGSTDEVSTEGLADAKNFILVTNVEEGDENILQFLADMKNNHPALKIMVVSRSESPATIQACLKVGVQAYLSKNISSDSFQNYLLFVALGERVLPMDIAMSLRTAPGFTPVVGTAKDLTVDFSPRERAILGYLIQGASNKVIARRLGIADGTVKVGVKMILRKIKATNRTQAAIWALQHDSFGRFLGEVANRSDEITSNPAQRNRPSRVDWTDLDKPANGHVIRFEDVATASG